MIERLLPEPGTVRRLALVTLVNTAGNGIFYTLSARSTSPGSSGSPWSRSARCRGCRAVLAACLVLLAASLTHVIGELSQASASFFLGFELAAPQAVGQHQGLTARGSRSQRCSRRP